jgi:hypothetical protein
MPAAATAHGADQPPPGMRATARPGAGAHDHGGDAVGHMTHRRVASERQAPAASHQRPGDFKKMLITDTTFKSHCKPHG